jgi:predicted Zn-dependent protease
MSTCHKYKRSLCLLAGALLFLLLSACAQNPVTGSNDFVMLSESSEISLGRTNHPKIIAQYGRYNDEALQAYVQSVGDRLAAVSHRNNLIYRFTVLDSPVINAFALPGGYVYITRGLMAYLNSESQLAAVLGHEIGHVTARHGVRQQSAAQAANIGFTIGSILVPELRSAPSQDLFNILGGALLSGYGRDHELESDGLGAEYLAKAGYEVNAMMDVIRVLKDQASFAEMQAKEQGKEVQSYHGLFASHPDNDTRLKEVVAKANQYQVNNGLVKRHEYLNQINGMTFGESEEQGITSGRHFYHLPMKFSVSFPESWQINNKPTSLQAISAGGEALIEVGVADINRKITPQQFIKERLKLPQLKSGKQLNSNGLEGYTGVFEAQGKPVRVSVVYLDNSAFIFFASTKQADAFRQLDNDFLSTAKSLHPLTPQEVPLARAKKLNVVTVSSQDSYRKWASISRITNSPQQQLRLLNGHFPSGELKAGQLAKRVD